MIQNAFINFYLCQHFLIYNLLITIDFNYLFITANNNTKCWLVFFKIVICVFNFNSHWLRNCLKRVLYFSVTDLKWLFAFLISELLFLLSDWLTFVIAKEYFSFWFTRKLKQQLSGINLRLQINFWFRLEAWVLWEISCISHENASFHERNLAYNILFVYRFPFPDLTSKLTYYVCL